MNDTWAERAQSSYERAQSAYDRQEPPEVRECRVCDGCGVVVVASVLDADGKIIPWPSDVLGGEGPEIPCPLCCYGASERERIRREKETHEREH